MRRILPFFLCLISLNSLQATPLTDFIDTLPVGEWRSFPTPTLDQQAMLRTGTGNVFNYADNAVWDTASQKLYFLGICHPRDGSELKGVLYDAKANQWRKAAVPAGPFTACFSNGWCIPHSYDQLSMDQKNGCAYFINSTGSTAHFFKYTFSTEKWDTVYVTYPDGSQNYGHYLYAGAMELFPEINSFIMYSGDYGNKGAILNRGVQPWKWQDFPDMFCFYHTLLSYNHAYHVMTALGCNKCGNIDTNKTITPIAQPAVNVHVGFSKAVCEPVTGATVIVQDDSPSRFLVYDPRGNQWHEREIKPAGILNQGVEAGSSVIFNMLDHGVIGILRYTAPYFLLYKFAAKADTSAPTGLQVFASDTVFEQFLTTRLTVVANGQDTVNASSFFYSLDTTLAVVEPGGVIRATGNGAGPVMIEVAKNTAQWEIKDTITLIITGSTAQLDSLHVTPGAVSILAGDSYPLTVTGFYRKGGASFSRTIDTAGIWSTADVAIATVGGIGLVTGVAMGGPVAISAHIGTASDTTLVKVLPKPSFIKRINFQVSSQPWSYGWLADNGGAFSAGKGFGWVSAGGFTSRDDRVGTTNFLLQSFVSTTSSTPYRVAVPDGDYIIKLGLGDPQYGSTDTVWFGSQVVLTHTGQSNAIGVDTVTVSGGGGLVLNVKGVFNYLVVISKEGIDINAVADDGGTAVPLPPSRVESTVVKAWPPLISLYPNPSHGAGAVRMALHGGSAADVRVVISDIRGKRVATLENRGLRRAVGEVVWNTAGMPAGVYVVKFFCGGRTFSRRMVVMR